MFLSLPRSAGTNYTAVLALLLLSMLISHVVLFAVGQVSYSSMSVAFVLNVIWLALACVSWTRLQHTSARLHDAPVRSK